MLKLQRVCRFNLQFRIFERSLIVICLIKSPQHGCQFAKKPYRDLDEILSITDDGHSFLKVSEKFSHRICVAELIKAWNIDWNEPIMIFMHATWSILQSVYNFLKRSKNLSSYIRGVGTTIISRMKKTLTAYTFNMWLHKQKQILYNKYLHMHSQFPFCGKINKTVNLISTSMWHVWRCTFPLIPIIIFSLILHTV